MFGLSISEEQKKELGKLLENIIYVSDPEKIDLLLLTLDKIHKQLKENNKVLEELLDTFKDNLVLFEKEK